MALFCWDSLVSFLTAILKSLRTYPAEDMKASVEIQKIVVQTG